MAHVYHPALIGQQIPACTPLNHTAACPCPCIRVPAGPHPHLCTSSPGSPRASSRCMLPEHTHARSAPLPSVQQLTLLADTLGKGAALLSGSALSGACAHRGHLHRRSHMPLRASAHPPPLPCTHRRRRYNHVRVQRSGPHSPKEATEEGHVDKRGKEAEVQEGRGVHAAVGGSKSAWPGPGLLP